MSEEEQQSRRWVSWTLRTLIVIGVVLLLAGSIWLWLFGVPALYRDIAVPAADQLKSVNQSRTAVLIGLAALWGFGLITINHRSPIRRMSRIGQVLVIVGAALFMVGFVWRWWWGVPALYSGPST